MNRATHFDEKLLTRLRKALPLVAHAKQPLLRALCARMKGTNISPALTVHNIFDASEAPGLMCLFTVDSPAMQKETFIAPIDQISFGRRHPFFQKIAAIRNPDRHRIAHTLEQ